MHSCRYTMIVSRVKNMEGEPKRFATFSSRWPKVPAPHGKMHISDIVTWTRGAQIAREHFVSILPHNIIFYNYGLLRQQRFRRMSYVLNHSHLFFIFRPSLIVEVFDESRDRVFLTCTSWRKWDSRISCVCNKPDLIAIHSRTNKHGYSIPTTQPISHRHFVANKRSSSTTNTVEPIDNINVIIRKLCTKTCTANFKAVRV